MLKIMGRKRMAASLEAVAEAASSDSENSMDSDSQSGSSKNKDDEPTRNTANARERARMRVLSKAFVRLKTTLPWVPADTKLSKLDTLRLASCYIGHLRQILQEDNPDLPPPTKLTKASPVHPMTLTWPFSFNGRPVPSSETNRHDTKLKQQGQV